MAIEPIETSYNTGRTITGSLFPQDSDTAVFTGRALTEESNRKTVYTLDVTENVSGYHTFYILEGGVVQAAYDIYLTNTTDTAYCTEVGTNTIIERQIAISDAQLSTSDLDTALSDIGLDHLVAVAVTGADVADDSLFAQLVSNSVTADWDDYDNIYHSLESIFDFYNTFSGTVTGNQAAMMSSLSTIVTDTNELQTDWENGGRLDLILDSILADTNELQTDWTNGGRLDLILDATATSTDVSNTQTAIIAQGDAAWITAVGFSTHSAVDVRNAVGLASASLDTQLADIPTVSEFNARTLVSSAYLDNTTWTDARAGYLDNLNVGGNVASQADIQGITVSSRVKINTPPAMEIPDSGSTDYRIYIYSYGETGQGEDLDAVPVVTAENNAATDRSSNLGTVTKVGATTGIYYVDYTVADTHDIEGLVFKVEATENAVATNYVASSMAVDSAVGGFTSSDRTILNTIATDTTTDLPTLINARTIDTGDYLQAADLPTNFVSLAIDGSGEVTVATNNDKTGYSISGTTTTLDALNTLVQAGFTQIKGAGWDTTDTLENIYNSTNTIPSGGATEAKQDTIISNLSTVSTNVSTIETSTTTTIPNLINGLENLSQATVLTTVGTALTNYGSPTLAEIQSEFTIIKGATWSALTDTLETIKDTVDLQATATALDTVASNVVLIVASTGTTIPNTLTQITTKTDDLTFTKSNELDVNVKSTNDVEVIGTGVVDDKWRGS